MHPILAEELVRAMQHEPEERVGGSPRRPGRPAASAGIWRCAMSRADLRERLRGVLAEPIRGVERPPDGAQSVT